MQAFDRSSAASTLSDSAVAMPLALDNSDYAYQKQFWKVQAIGWTILATFGFCIRLLVFQNLAVAVVCTAVVDVLGFLATSAMARQPFTRIRAGTVIRSLASAGLWCVSISAVLALVAYRIRLGMAPVEEPTIRGNEYVIGLIYHLSIITAWTLAYLGVRAEMEARANRMQALAAETRALRLEVESLQLQIEPHFLFNALNTIVSEIGERPAIAEEMTRGLAGYLRYSLKKRDTFVGSLADEIEAVEMYLRIQALRFDDRFTYSCQVDPQALTVSIPHMAIQCLVENAIKHGLQTQDRSFHIGVRVAKHGPVLHIEVDNPEHSGTPIPIDSTGIGLTNLQRRLDIRYPSRNSFSLSSHAGRTLATLKIEGHPCG